MHIIQNYTLKKNFVKKMLPLVMALLQGIKKLFGPLLDDLDCQLATAFHFTICTFFKNSIADSPTSRYGESATPRLADAGPMLT
jgi:hypothetical protein